MTERGKPYYQEPKHTIYCGHALDILKEMPAESVDMVITSPPYWGLRTYKTEPIIWGDGCEHEWGRGLVKAQAHRAGETNPGKEGYTKDADAWSDKQGQFCLKCGCWRGELGLEPTIELYIQHLILIFAEVRRVLKKTGTCWVNLDDSYAGSGCGTNDYRTEASRSINKSDVMFSKSPPQQKLKDIPAKSLCLIPQRFAIAMVENGWILRNDIVWNKANPMPESVKDRFTGSWEHLFFFVKSKKYWFEQQFEEQHPDGRKQTIHMGCQKYADGEVNKAYAIPHERWGNPLGRNMRDVWEINTQPYPEAHFATFPEKLCETPILAGCPNAICKKCGKARERVLETINSQRTLNKGRAGFGIDEIKAEVGKGSSMAGYIEIVDSVYTDCGCEPKEYEPGIVLDPFTGSGTAQAVAKRLGRKSIGIELNPNYCKLAAKRLQEIPLSMEL